MKLLSSILLICCLFLYSPSFSQSKNNGTVHGSVTDTASGQNLKGATVSILHKADSSVAAYGLCSDGGTFKLENVAPGDYILVVSFLGFSEISQQFTITREKPDFDAGKLVIQRSSVTLGEVVVRSSPITVKGDTTEFNAAQIKTVPNATTEDLLKKLPGVEVEKDGTVKAQGETVTRVLVDGKRFFGNDPALATKNLPADIIDKVQVIDAPSEQSAFSGFDDGERVKTINIITKKDKKKGLFGKGSVAAGNEDRKAGAISAHQFSGNQQVSFIIQGNNINNQSFTVQDFLGGTGGGNRGGGGGGGRGGRGGSGANISSGGSSGISTTYAGGINYNDVWGKKTLVNGNYFYNNINAANNRDRFRETFVRDSFSVVNPDSSLFNTSRNTSVNKSQNHRFNLEIDHRFDSMNSLLIRPSLAYQENDSYSESNSYSTKGKLSPLSDVHSFNQSKNTGYNFNNSILFRHRFKKTGRTFSINFTQAYNTNDRNGTNLSYNNTFRGTIDTLDQVSTNERESKSWGVNLSFTERIGSHSQMEVTYNYNHNESNSDQQTYKKDNTTQQYTIAVPNLTNLFENTNSSHRAGINYRMQLSPEWSYSAGMAIQHAELASNNFTKTSFLSQSFNNFFPAFLIQYRKTRAKSFRFSYRGSTQQPSITQLQDVVDNSNVLNVTGGNPGLKQEFNNNFNLNYNSINLSTFKSFFINFSGSFTSNRISNTSVINDTRDTIIVEGYELVPGAQFTRPQNLDGAFSFGGSANISLPIKKPKSNLSINSRVNFGRDVNLVNGKKGFTKNYSIGGGVRYTINVQERLDLNFSGNSTYNMARYSDQGAANTNFLTHRLSVEPTLSTKNGWIVANDFDYIINTGQSEGYNQAIPLWNASIAKLFLKKKEAEIRFTFFDLLNQNKSITRNVEQNYIEDVRTQVLNRYFLVSFTYFLRKFQGQPGRDNNFRRNNFNGGRF